ncbi:zinc finger protein 25-like [Acyrthosiphon pisum]|uniref:C2H2-type domain-containing protein n=1 Tax=Acyrthosiphon pisum TaxID=7029 RepID=A0A8R2F8P6_ACYPI|nr:zinc finger protein 25-like [Acyrthosiphon pisum]|eukprot:XP_008181525.1 PREDICTED: zinc finger protein 25-like [Acyrthosiphon pisum]
MIGAELLAQIDPRLKEITGNYIDNFGGLDIIFIGDLRQLPPVRAAPIDKSISSFNSKEDIDTTNFDDEVDHVDDMVHSMVQRSQLMLSDIEPEKNTYNCHLCKSSFPKKRDLSKHQKSHKKNYENSYKPKNSHSTFPEELHLTKHNKTPEPKKTKRLYECSLCRSTFPTASKLESHTKYHIGDSPLIQCHLCDALFILQSYLSIHMRSHFVDKPYQCRHCLATFAQKKSYSYHLKTHRDLELRRCIRCNMLFFPKTKLIKRFKCVECNKRFGQKAVLRSHMRTHSIEQKYKCDTCGVVFEQKSNLIKHIKKYITRKSHTKETCLCLICLKSFFEKKELTLHIKLHMKNMSSECLICKKPFLQVPVSAKVLRDITGNKKNICDVCSVIF